MWRGNGKIRLIIKFIMRVLMVSLDRGLLGAGASGDALLRHQKYADSVGALDMIVFASPAANDRMAGANLRIFSTQSSKFSHFDNAVAVAQRLSRENKYDLLVTQDFAAPAGKRIKKLLGIPWIVNVHGMFFSRHWLAWSPLKWYLYFRIRGAIESADGFRVNNEEIKAKLQSWGVGRPILVQPTPVDMRKFMPPHPGPFPLKAEREVALLLYVGRLSPEKNVTSLIRAFKGITGDNVELYIVGEGPEEEKLKNLAKGDGRIKFLGSKTHEELIAIYQSSDIFVLPSNTESYGKVLIEAGAAGCALIATRTPGARGIIADGQSGILVNIGDEQGLQKAIQKLIDDPGSRQAMARGAQEMAEGYDLDRAIENTVNFWKKIVI